MSCQIVVTAFLTTRALRHIRLLNTPEQKPITNSRDTQELHYEAGCEVLQIFLDYQAKSKTSLLQDFAYYEVCPSHCQADPSVCPPTDHHLLPASICRLPCRQINPASVEISNSRPTWRCRLLLYLWVCPWGCRRRLWQPIPLGSDSIMVAGWYGMDIWAGMWS